MRVEIYDFETRKFIREYSDVSIFKPSIVDGHVLLRFSSSGRDSDDPLSVLIPVKKSYEILLFQE